MGKRRKITPHRFSLIHGQILCPALMHEPEFARTRSGSRGLHPAVLPGQVHLKPAPRTQSRGGTLLPAVRQGRNQKDDLKSILHDLALDQALGHSGGKAEVAVNLKWRMRVEQIGIGAARVQQQSEDPVGPVAVAEAVERYLR